MQTIETRRVILRDISIDDLEDFYEYASNKEVATSSGWMFHKNKEESKKILERLVNDKDVYAIVYKENNKVIGSVGLHDINLDFSFENKNQLCIGYSLSKDYWSQGLMTEAILAVLDHCFTDLKLDIVWAGHTENNESSRKVLERIGFTFTHRYFKYIKEIQKRYESLAYIYKKEDYYG